MKIILFEDGNWCREGDYAMISVKHLVLNLGGGDWTDREISSMIQEYYETFPFD